MKVPNIPARAQTLSEPGSVVVTARAQRQAAERPASTRPCAGRAGHERPSSPSEPAVRGPLLLAVDQLALQLAEQSEVVVRHCYTIRCCAPPFPNTGRVACA